jgi:hypothetical protein
MRKIRACRQVGSFLSVSYPVHCMKIFDMLPEYRQHDFRPANPSLASFLG